MKKGQGLICYVRKGLEFNSDMYEKLDFSNRDSLESKNMRRKVVHANLSKFLKDQQILAGKQGGFRKGLSTASTIADLADYFFYRH